MTGFDAAFEQYGFSILNDAKQLAQHEASTISLTNFEDAKNQHKKHNRKTRGTQASCELRCERGLPPLNAKTVQNLKYQQRYETSLKGGYDPLQLIRKDNTK